MNVQQLKKHIRQLQKPINDQIDNLNDGGCGFFAYMVCKKLRKLKLDVDIATPLYSSRLIVDADTKRKALRKRQIYTDLYHDPDAWDYGNSDTVDSRGISRFHLVASVKLDTGDIVYFDSNRIVVNSNRFSFEGRRLNLSSFGKGLTIREVEQMCKRHPRAWNRLFDRDQVNKLSSIINKHFSLCQTKPLL